MEITGSLQEFLEKGPKILYSRPQTAFKSSQSDRKSCEKKETLAKRLDLESRQYGKVQLETRPTGYIYQTPSRGTIRAASAKPCSKNLSKSPTRPQNPSERPQSEMKVKPLKKEKIVVSLQEQVRNELKNKHYVIRSMKKIMRSDEQKEESGEKAKNTLFSRLAKRFENPTAKFVDKEIKPPVQTENLIQKLAVVKDKEIAADRKPWLKKRGLLGNSEDSDFAKTVFNLIQHNGEVKSSAFFQLLASIGVPLPIFLVKQTLSRVFHQKNTETYTITEKSMMALCKTDEFEKNLLSIFVHHLSLSNKSSVTLNESSATQSLFIHSHDMKNLIKDWWTELDYTHSHSVHLNEVSEFLQKKSIVADAGEGRKFLSKFHFPNFIDFTQFLKIFAKLIIKNSLRSICQKISSDLKDNFFSNEYNLTVVRKKILFAGIKYPVPEFSAEEGISAIENIQKITKFEPVNLDEHRAIWSKNLREELKKSPEKVEKPRMMAKIFIKENEEFQHTEESKEKSEVSGIENWSILGSLKVDSESGWKHSVAPKINPFVVQTIDGASKIYQQKEAYKKFVDGFNI